MLRYCLCLLAGAASLAAFDRLPGDGVFVATLLLGLLAACWPPARCGAAALAGALLLWAASRAGLGDRVAPELVGKDLSFRAEIIDFTVIKLSSARLLVRPDPDPSLPSRVRLSWYGAERVPRLGEHWEFEVRLRRPRGFANPGGFDYAGWLFRQRIGATGYVIAGRPAGSGPDPPLTTALRRDFVARVDALLPDDDATAVLLAITVGARHRIDRAAWERYARTGTTHLMAISGLHVGLAAGAAFAVSRLLLALLLPRINARDPALLMALGAAAAYAELSGFAVPARRAVLMAAMVAAAVLLRQRLSLPRVLALACLLVVAADPLSVLAPGFRLSFAAVALLLWIGAQRAGTPVDGRLTPAAVVRAVQGLGRLQCALLFGLFPLTALLFARVSWLAPLANLLVLPVFSFVTVPAGLLGLTCAGPLAIVGDAGLWLCWYSLRGVLAVIEGLAGLPGAHWPLAEPKGFAVVVYCLPALWVLLPPGMPGRRLAWPALLAAMLYRPPAPPPACLDLHVLDVGQGLAAVVRTQSHTLVFDTGPAFRGGGDTARLVLLPFLQSLGRHTVDLAIVSHADQDHAGGLGSLVGGVEVRQILAGEPQGLQAPPELRCQAGTRWHWDGIDFSMLYPAANDRRDGNNASCVLEVSAGRHRVLLTGDIERAVERLLLGRALLRPADIVIMPHHGSRTSSSAPFVRALKPRHAIVASGFGNRWGFPKADVVARWSAEGATVSSTATGGAVTFRVCSDGGIRRILRHRQRSRRYWHDLTE